MQGASPVLFSIRDVGYNVHDDALYSVPILTLTLLTVTLTLTLTVTILTITIHRGRKIAYSRSNCLSLRMENIIYEVASVRKGKR